MSDANLKRLIDTQKQITEKDIEKGVPALRTTMRHLETQGNKELISLMTDLPAYSKEL